MHNNIIIVSIKDSVMPSDCCLEPLFLSTVRYIASILTTILRVHQSSSSWPSIEGLEGRHYPTLYMNESKNK
jgi:hypothetical protein